MTMTIVDDIALTDVANHGAGSVFVAVGKCKIGDVVMLRDFSKRFLEVQVIDVEPNTALTDWVEVAVYDRSKGVASG